MKLTLDYIKSQVVDACYDYNGTFTVCTIITESGTKLCGTSGCLDPENYDRAIGEKVAYDNAVSQLWALEGYFFSKLGLATCNIDAAKVRIAADYGHNPWANVYLD